MPALDHNYGDGRARRMPFSGTAAAVGIGVILVAAVFVVGYVLLHGDRRAGLVWHSSGDSALSGTVSQRKPSPGIPFPSRSTAVASATAAPVVPPTAPVEVAEETAGRLGPARNAPGVYFAKHQKSFGRGCDGKLALTAAGLDFSCTQGSEPPLHFTVDEIKGPNGNGIQLKTGEKYHFDLGTTKPEEQQIFVDWAAAHVPGAGTPAN